MQFGKTRSVLGLELISLADQLFSCRSVLLSKKGNSVQIISCKNVSGTLSEVIAAQPKDYPVSLTLSGQGIIHKIQQIGENPSQLFSIAFPSIDRKEFYVQQAIGDHNGLVSIIRKVQANDLLAKLKGAGLHVYMLSLGGIVTMPIWSQLNVYDTKFQFDGHSFMLTETRNFDSYRFDSSFKADFPMKIDQELIPEENIVAYAAAFQLMLQENISPIIADVDELNESFIAFNAQQKIKEVATIFIFGLFALLLVSFLTFVHYNQENETLSGQLGSITATSDQAALAKENIAEHKAVLEELNWNGGYNYGFLLNEIGSSIPKQLKLSSVGVDEFKAEKKDNYTFPYLKIIGTTTNLTAVNNWIFVLKEKPWVKSVKLERFEEEPDSEDYQFNLILTY